MIAAALLSRLEGCKRIGVDRWLARCPAHNDKRPSLAVREIDGDRVLVKCFSGCATSDVLAAVGMDFESLFPARPTNHCRPERRPFPAADVLRAVEHEALLTAVAAGTLSNGIQLTAEDRKRLVLASTRISAAVKESGYAG
jgi:hypothetical protein